MTIIQKGERMDDLISRQAAIDAIMGQPPEPHYPTWYAAQIEKLPAVQPDHIADVSKKVERTDETAQNVSDSDLISREAVIDALAKFVPYAICDESTESYANGLTDAYNLILQLPSAQPEIIHCGECIYYDPPHVEKEDARYEYSEMPKEAFDVLGTGLVSMEYGINIGGRCCVDYYCKSYSDDKRVYVREDNYCGRAERRTDE